MTPPIAVTLVALALAGSPSPAPSPSPSPAPPREVRLERRQWSRSVEGPDPITAIEIRNDFGDIRARYAADRTLDASMVVQRLDPGPQGVGFTVERRGPALALVVAYPPGRIRDADPRPPKDRYDRLDLVIFVPAGVTLRAHTLRGLVEVRGLRSDVEAATLDGEILIAATGTIQARTSTGAITATVSADALAGAGPPLLFQSASGPVSLILPAAGSAELRIDAGGAVTSKVELERKASGERTRATATLGAGDRLVVVTTVGPVRIDRD
jgi:hypothetical protein